MYKINKEILIRIIPNRADKRKTTEKKEKSFKAQTIERLSPSSKRYCFSTVYYFILECLEFKYFSAFHDPSTLKSILPALPNSRKLIISLR